MNAANINNSERLQRVYCLLSDGLVRSTMQIVKSANVCAVNSIVAELRSNGASIKCWREGQIWYYQMEKAA